MNVEIVFTGLCSILNPQGKNTTMPDPSVILVRTDDQKAAELKSLDVRSSNGHDEKVWSMVKRRPRPSADQVTKDAEEEPSHDHAEEHEGHEGHEHVPFIAYNIDTTQLLNDSESEEVPMSDGFRFRRLKGQEITIDGHAAGQPDANDPSLDKLVSRDAYWPEAENQWNHDFVPEPGGPGKPTKSAVVGFMRFGKGKLTASRICPFEWVFPKLDGTELRGNFAEEVVYSFPHEADEVVIRLTDLDDDQRVEELRFSQLPDGGETMTLFIGNNMLDDMDNAVDRRFPSSIKNNTHFEFLNRTAAIAKGAGPLPKVNTVANLVIDPLGGGGGSSGPCGPNNGNGKTGTGTGG